VEALARELREETGLELAAAQLLDARTYAVQRNGVNWSLTALFYTADLKAGALAVAEIDGSTDAAVWTPPWRTCATLCCRRRLPMRFGC
jgi:8-oxo-dGTP diphosphatase